MDSTWLLISIIVVIVSFIAIVVFSELKAKAKANTTSKQYKTYGILYMVSVGTLIAGVLSACYGFFREENSHAAM